MLLPANYPKRLRLPYVPHSNWRFSTRLTPDCRWAPYSREIRALLARGHTPNVFCFAGSEAWQQARRRRITHRPGSAILLPPGEHPDSFRWPTLDALVLIPGHEVRETILALIVRLLSSGCRCVIEIRPDLAPVAHYSKKPDLAEVPV